MTDTAHMVWYPSADDIIEINRFTLELTDDKHPHRLRGARRGLQSLVEGVKQEEWRGLTYQAGKLMRDILTIHAFDNANHRTAYSAAFIFLRANGVRVHRVVKEVSESFTKSLPERTLEEIQAWILENMVEL